MVGIYDIMLVEPDTHMSTLNINTFADCWSWEQTAEVFKVSEYP